MSELAEALAQRVILPLMIGGDVLPLAPIGPKRAEQLGDQLTHPTLAEAIQKWMLRRMRPLWPVDQVALPQAEDWALAAAFNDLLQTTNPTLEGPWAKNRAITLLEMCNDTIFRASAPANAAAALRRHALFGRCLELERKDTRIGWWTGSRQFVGRRPPARLLAWPNLRRVTKQTTSLNLGQMMRSSSTTITSDSDRSERFSSVLQRFLHANPLTDLAEAARSSPPFEWSGATIGLLSIPAGRALTLRILARRNVSLVSAALAKAKAVLPENDKASHGVVSEFVEELARVSSA